ncbi:MAG: phage head-tail joining protein [Burkholderiaceae bacterium]
MAFTTADLTAIDRAIAASELEVELEGRKVRFDNFEGLKARREFIAGQLTAARPTGAFRYRFTTSRGD